MDEQIEALLAGETHYVCGLCGAWVYDAIRHQEWHDIQLAAAAVTAVWLFTLIGG